MRNQPNFGPLVAAGLLGLGCGSSSPGTSHAPPDLSSHVAPDLGQGPLHDLAGPIGANGGSVDHLYFAVSGDTRPADIDDTASYPTSIVTKMYQDLQAMNPRPQFAVATGDYQYATASQAQGAPQIALYHKAQAAYSGVLFAAMGNHECDGYTADNCTTPTNNYTAFADAFLKPIGKDLPYYSVPLQALDGSWTAKLLIIACNYWSTTQQSWLAGEMARPTTYTILVRHEPASATTGPCVSDVETLMASNPYDLSLVGHTHHYQANGKEIIVGNGGAPLSGGVYGYATVEQTSAGFVISNYDTATAASLGSVTVPFH